MIFRAQGGQVVGAQMVSATDGSNFAGTVNVFIELDTQPQQAGSVNGGVAVSKGNGSYQYSPTAAETDGAIVAYIYEGSGAVSVKIQVATLTPAQVSALQTATGLGSVIVSDLVTDAYAEIRVARAGDVLAPELMDFGVGKLNRLLDRYNANPRAQYGLGFQSFTPIANHAPHTLGPNTADWTVAQRPAVIKGANLILNNVSPAVRIPIHIRDEHWWRNQSVQGLATSIVTDLYYSDDWPNGNVFLWPIPTATYPIELETNTLFTMLQATDVFWLPFGYRDTVTLRLGCDLASSNGQTPSPYLVQAAQEAEATIFGLNDSIPNLNTRDAGMPNGSSRRGRYNYLTGRLM